MRTFMIFVAAISLAISASAQDLLVKRNGEKIEVKVLKVTKNKVQFVRHGTELPVYTLPTSEIDYIEYPMGDRDVFNKSSVASQPKEQTPQATNGGEPKRWHGPVPPHNGVFEPVRLPQEANKEAETYSIGEIYEKNGIKGIVVKLENGGKSGVIMSLDESCKAWCTLRRKRVTATGADNRADGEANMKAIEQYIKKNNLSWSDFPAFEWCRAKGEGWYLPSINEIWSAGTIYLGGSRTATNRRFRKSFNARIESAGGTPLSGIMLYHSSTEDKDVKYSLYSHMNSEPPFVQSGYKADELFVRAFKKF